MNSKITQLSGYNLAVRAERIDSDNWFDEFARAPQTVASALGLAARREGELAMVRSHIPFSHFNMVMTLGCPAAPDDRAFEAIEHFYAEGRAEQHWILVNDYSQPAELPEQLAARGYQFDGAWERVVLQGVHQDLWVRHAHGCEIVAAGNAEEWSRFRRQLLSDAAADRRMAEGPGRKSGLVPCNQTGGR